MYRRYRNALCLRCGTSAANTSDGSDTAIVETVLEQATVKTLLEQACTKDESSRHQIDESPLDDVRSTVGKCWDVIEQQCDAGPASITAACSETSQGPQKAAWQTVRVFVSSTFTDFHSEREVLVKQVFPQLRSWCNDQKLTLVECDLRWGVPKDSTTFMTLKACMEELDRCHDETGGKPFFINMLGERYGWIPQVEDIGAELMARYSWVPGVSVTSMEVFHGAYRSANPNALFLLRDKFSLDGIPEDKLLRFRDEQPVAVEHLRVLKKKLRRRFPNQVEDYTCVFEGVEDSSGQKKVKLGQLQKFADSVLSFLKSAITQHFPSRQEITEKSQEEQEYDAHLSWVEQRASEHVGRHEEVQTLLDFMFNGSTETLEDFPGVENNDEIESKYKEGLEMFRVTHEEVPLVCVLGVPGAGKSTLLAKVAQEAHQGGFPTFYHCVGCSSISVTALGLERRLLHVLKSMLSDEYPLDVAEASHQDYMTHVCKIFEKLHGSGKKLLIILDGVNELDTRAVVHHLAWLPPALPDGIRCIVSSSDDHPLTLERLSWRKPRVLRLAALSHDTRKSIVHHFFGKYNKVLDNEQLDCLTSPSHAAVPLWLSLACEELRVHGNFSTVTQKIVALPGSVADLLQLILSRVLNEDDTNCMEKLLCLIECSLGGVPEEHIPALLGDIQSDKPLPLMTWALIRSILRPFLRVSISSYGLHRVHFFHQTFSQAVSEKLLASETDRRKWHAYLADYYHKHCVQESFVIQDLPQQLIHAGQMTRLINMFRSDRIFGTRIPAYMKRIVLQDHRCRMIGGKDKPSLVKICQMCDSRPGTLSPSWPGKQACFLCGSVTQANMRKPVCFCIRHQVKFMQQRMCVLCNRMSGDKPVHVCNGCALGGRCCFIET